ncbi:MAG: hypothetical protein ACK4NO_07815 [Glycocaulis sp.]
MSAGHIRDVRPEDIPDIARLVARCGFPVRSLAGWRWVLFENPDQGDAPPGWVYEAEGRVAGFLGNFVMRYAGGGEELAIATGHTMVSDLEGAQRRVGLKLVRHGVAQPGVDGFVTLNNNAISGAVLRRAGGLPWLGAPGREWAEWVLRPDRILLSRLPSLRPGGERHERDFALETDGRCDMRGVTLLPLEDIADRDINALGAQGCIARKVSLDHLRYRLADPDRLDGAGYRAAAMDGEVLALAGFVLTKPAPERLEHLEIVDWLARDCERGRIAQRVLLEHVITLARKAGIARVRLHFPRNLPAGVLSAGGPYVMRHHGHDPCHAHFTHPALHGWQPGPGDADYFFAFRIPPRLTTQQ